MACISRFATAISSGDTELALGAIRVKKHVQLNEASWNFIIEIFMDVIMKTRWSPIFLMNKALLYTCNYGISHWLSMYTGQVTGCYIEYCYDCPLAVKSKSMAPSMYANLDTLSTDINVSAVCHGYCSMDPRNQEATEEENHLEKHVQSNDVDF